MSRPSGVFEITDIPADQVETVIANLIELEDPPPPDIVKKEQGGNLFTVTATYSPGPEKRTKKFGS